MGKKKKKSKTKTKANEQKTKGRLSQFNELEFGVVKNLRNTLQ